ncbi:hypothetical protein SAMN02745165_01903 [Malonomonas rubra DSM 5091]|uniref:Uncharacterized protein n=1 Tax=Malonomonas rubra DSM 5091 TaxID=1122189 RepID=A0A1M6HNX3_MALRU|nr:hypothetical protein [Malonomonas rubra]SHJ23912.1 hypothetical protein SAMN02745165_01903 [Malonomonas rubra DSM 5091]
MDKGQARLSSTLGTHCQKIDFEIWLLKDQLKNIKKFVRDIDRHGGLDLHEEQTLSGMSRAMSKHWLNIHRELGDVRKALDEAMNKKSVA